MISPPFDGLKDAVIGSNTHIYMNVVMRIVQPSVAIAAAAACSHYLQLFTLLYFDMECSARRRNELPIQRETTEIYSFGERDSTLKNLKCLVVRPVIENERKYRIARLSTNTKITIKIIMLTLSPNRTHRLCAVVMCVMVHEKASNISMAFGAHCCLLCVCGVVSLLFSFGSHCRSALSFIIFVRRCI